MFFFFCAFFCANKHTFFFFPRAFLTAENPVPDCVYTGQSPDVHGQQTVFICFYTGPVSRYAK